MKSNFESPGIAAARARLRRLPDGRYEIGVHIHADGHGRFIADVVAPRTSPAGVVTIPVMRLRGATFDDMAAISQAWITEHIPAIYGISGHDLQVTLMKKATFDD